MRAARSRCRSCIQYSRLADIHAARAPSLTALHGIALFDSPNNPGHPTPFHVRNFGLLTHIGVHDWTLKDGQSQTLRHRLLFHPGDASSAKLDERCKEFAGGR